MMDMYSMCMLVGNSRPSYMHQKLYKMIFIRHVRPSPGTFLMSLRQLGFSAPDRAGLTPRIENGQIQATVKAHARTVFILAVSWKAIFSKIGLWTHLNVHEKILMGPSPGAPTCADTSLWCPQLSTSWLVLENDKSTFFITALCSVHFLVPCAWLSS